MGMQRIKLHSMGTDALFEKHTIKEIHDIEKKIRNDIEQKKEELRLMVGERYRDLIEAADTISMMKSTTNQVKNHIEALEHHRLNLHVGKLQINVREQEMKSTVYLSEAERLYGVAAEIKLLVDIPLKIWSALEQKDIISAAQLFLLAQHTHTTLLLQSCPMNRWFPVIGRQWSIIGHFCPSILQHSREMLKSQDISTKDLPSVFCCVIILEESSVQNVFHEFLQIREAAITEIFSPENHGVSTREQVCSVVSLVMQTMHAVWTVFYTSTKNGSSLIVEFLERLMNKNIPGPLNLWSLPSFPMLQYIPPEIRDYRPSVRSSLIPMEQKELQDSCHKWIERVQSLTQDGLSHLFNYINTVQGIAHIHHSVSTLLTEEDSLTCWQRATEDLLGGELLIWDYFLKPVFIGRIKKILGFSVEDAFEICKKSIGAILKDIKMNQTRNMHFESLVSYTWVSAGGDLGSRIQWSSHMQQPVLEGGSLAMKARCFTPQVQSLCRTLDSRLKDILQDLSHFKENGEKLDHATSQFPKDLLPTSLLSQPSVTDGLKRPKEKEVHSHLQSVVNGSLTGLLTYIAEKVADTTVDNENRIRNWIPFLGHLCRGLAELCPHLQQCFPVLSSEATSKQSKNATDVASLKVPVGWTLLKAELQKQSNYLFQIWIQEVCLGMVKELKSVITDCSSSGLLKLLLVWDHVEIQEETEEGKPVKSTIHIPMQPSSPLVRMLFQLSQKFNGALGHSLSRNLVREQAHMLLGNILQVYEEAAQQKFPENQDSTSRLRQTRSLQLLFDTWFVSGLLGPKEGSSHPLAARTQHLIMSLESCIDPFDLDVFMPYLQANATRSIQRLLQVLGLLVPLEKIGLYRSQKPTAPTGSVEMHDILVVSSGCGRFPLLPVSSSVPRFSYAGSSSTTPMDSPSKTIRSISSSPELTKADIQSGVSKSASFYDRMTAMSSSWFGGH